MFYCDECAKEGNYPKTRIKKIGYCMSCGNFDDCNDLPSGLLPEREKLKGRSKDIDLLQEYSIWLTKNGYMDTDWKDEEPFAIDEFMKTKK